MSNFGRCYPILRDTQDVIAGRCTGRVVRLQPVAPAYGLGVANPETDFWQDEDGTFIFEGDDSPIILQ
jgi:hypothetical protein